MGSIDLNKFISAPKYSENIKTILEKNNNRNCENPIPKIEKIVSVVNQVKLHPISVPKPICESAVPEVIKAKRNIITANSIPTKKTAVFTTKNSIQTINVIRGEDPICSFRNENGAWGQIGWHEDKGSYVERQQVIVEKKVYDPQYERDLKQRFKKCIDLIIQTNNTKLSKFELTKARMNLLKSSIEEPYDKMLQECQSWLVEYYFKKDGSLDEDLPMPQKATYIILDLYRQMYGDRGCYELLSKNILADCNEILKKRKNNFKYKKSWFNSYEELYYPLRRTTYGGHNHQIRVVRKIFLFL